MQTASVSPVHTPAKLTVCYDEQCALCRRCRAWLEGQPLLVPLDFVAAGSPEACERYRDVPWLGADLVVIDDERGDVWAGPAAFLMCLWATADYRGWSYRLSGRALAPLAERFFHTVSANRRRIGRVVGSRDCPDGRCTHRAEPLPTRWVCPACGAPWRPGATHCWSCRTPWRGVG